jgi:peptidoglycan/LPS O-acetylase OafA/YrhL
VFALLAIVGGWAWLKSGWLFYGATLHHFHWFAPISYAVYICHDPIMRGATYLSFIDNPILRWLGYFLIMLLVSFIIEILIYPAVRRWLQPRVEAIFPKARTTDTTTENR